MRALEDFQHHLNSSSTRDRFIAWKIYRERVGIFVTDHLKLFNKLPSVYIAGAGRCDDINLPLFIENADTIVLSDIDIQSMVYGVHRQNAESVTVEQEDYLGIDKLQLMEGLERLIMQKHSMMEFECYLSYITQLMRNGIEGNEKNGIVDRTFDVVVSMPIYTQLLFPQVNQLLSQACELGRLTWEDYVLRQRTVLDMMPEILDYYNKHLLKKLKDNGMLIVFSDLLEDKQNGHYLQAFRRGEDFDMIMSDYMEAYGMGLGNYGLYQLGTVCREVSTQWFEWPFDNDRFMIVKGIAFDKQQSSL